jgi:hypothetical protein
MKWLSLILACLALTGCVWPGVDTHEKHPVIVSPDEMYHPGQN